MKPTADFSNFDALDIRIGRVVEVEDADTRKPLYRVKVDFGVELGTRVSVAGYVNYRKEDLQGRLVAAVVNLAPKKMGPERSEILILGAPNANDEPMILAPDGDVPLGAGVY